MILNTNTLRAAAISTIAVLAGCAMSDETALTIYSTATPGAINPDLYRPVPGAGTMGYNAYRQIPGYAIVKQQRNLQIERGISDLSFRGVAALLDPTTVLFESLSDPGGTSVLEQDYKYDLLSMSKMLERYIDQTILVNGQEVTLLSSSNGGMLVQGSDGAIEFMSGYNGVKFPAVGEGLITRPTLSWKIKADHAGEQETRISYETKGITWWADYNLVFEPGEDANHGSIDVGAWVSILNQSGGSYENANLKLVAGDVNRAPQRTQNTYLGAQMRGMVAEDSMSKGFEEKAFFEYHLYTLGRPTTIPDRSTKQIELFEQTTDVPVEKVYEYDGSAMFAYYGGRQDNEGFGIGGESKVQVYLKFKNDEEHGMGMPLPSGRIRVNQLDTGDGSFEFIGEDTIDHTPRNETVIIKMGNAFDVVGERRRTAFKRGSDWITESFEIKVRNQKTQPVRVHVKEHLYRWSNASITQMSHERTMLDAQTMHIPVTIEPEGEQVITYTVHYSW